MNRKAASPPSLKPGPTDLQPPPRLESAPEGIEPAGASMAAIIGALEAEGWVLEKMTEDALVFHKAVTLSRPTSEAPQEAAPAEALKLADSPQEPSQEETLPDGPPPAPKAPPRPASGPVGPPEPPPAASVMETLSKADVCTSNIRWPGSSGWPELQHCFWHGPEGCRLVDADRPMTCINAGKGGKPPSPEEEEIVGTREGQWAQANAVPVPRTLFDGNAAALGLMPDDIYRASMACLDGGPRKTSAKPRRTPALPPGIVVGEKDAQGNPIPEAIEEEARRACRHFPGQTACDWCKGQVVHPEDDAPSFEEVTKDHDFRFVVACPKCGTALGEDAHDKACPKCGPTRPPSPKAAEAMEAEGIEQSEAAKWSERLYQRYAEPAKEVPVVVLEDGSLQEQVPAEPPTLEERVARDGIFEALQQSEPPRATEPRDVVLDFETPVEAQRLPNGRGTVYVKRDDLFAVAGVRGGKARTCWALATATKAEGLITAGSRSSPQCNIVAHIARRLGVPCRLHIPWAKAPLEGELAEAEALGAEVVQHQYGRNSVIVARAREDARQRPDWTLIPFGMECREAVEQTRRQARSLRQYGRTYARLVVPVGSGMSLAGILWGLGEFQNLGAADKKDILGICVGADPRRRLDEWAPKGWRQAVTLQAAPGGRDAYQRPAAETRLGDLALDPIYEAKCLPFLRPRDLLWVVGIRNTVAGHRS
jgi:hypothetical protein